MTALPLPTLPRLLLWVWAEPPGELPDGWTALVRAANGAATHGVVDYADNFHAWRRAHPGRVLPWTWLGPPAPGTGELAARTLLRVAGRGADLYVADIEGAAAPEDITAFASVVRQEAPGALLAFSSYPTRAQAWNAGRVPWDALTAVFDIGMPQVYFPGQRARLSTVVADHRGLGLHVALSPDDDPSWSHTARWALEHCHGVSIWRNGLPATATWLQTAGQLARGDTVSTTDLEAYFGHFPIADGQRTRGETIAKALPAVQDVHTQVDALAALVRAQGQQLAKIGDDLEALASGQGSPIDADAIAERVIERLADRLHQA